MGSFFQQQDKEAWQMRYEFIKLQGLYWALCTDLMSSQVLSIITSFLSEAKGIEWPFTPGRHGKQFVRLTMDTEFQNLTPEPFP